MIRSLRLAQVPFLFVIASIIMPGLSFGQHGATNSQKQQHRQMHLQRYQHEHSDPTGTPRPDLLRKALQQIKQMPFAAGVPASSGGFHPTASPSGGLAPMALSSGSSPLTGVQWTQIGPAPLVIDAEQNFQGNGPDSGQILEVAFSAILAFSSQLMPVRHGCSWEPRPSLARTSFALRFRQAMSSWWQPRLDCFDRQTVG